jgi:integrase
MNSENAIVFPHKVTEKGVTVTIYRGDNKGYPEYRVVWYEGDRRKVANFSGPDDAKAKARAVCRSVAAGDHSAITLRSKDAAVYQRAIDALKAIGAPLDLAAERYAAAISRLGEVPLPDAVEFYLRKHPTAMPRKRVSDAAREMIEAKRTDGASTIYLRDLEFRMQRFADAFKCTVAGVTAPLLNEWLRGLDCSGRSRNNYRATVGTFINFCEAQGWLPKDHIDFSKIAKAQEEQTEIDIFTPKEMMALLKAAQLNPDDLDPGFNRRYASRQGLLPLLVLGGFAGMRTAEVCRQLWTDINLERGYIRVTAAKGHTAQKRLIPITENLAKWLSICRQESETCCDYPRSNEAIQRLANRAGIKWKHNALRHSFISYRLAIVQSTAQVALEAGNSAQMIFRHYRELVSKTEAESWFSITPSSATITDTLEGDTPVTNTGVNNHEQARHQP